ncbi:hypothetical protein BDY24DRAFT_110980 [Mrakia frigida]|uniref:uncharacterized protein n=1 Tax=Mrakia frigida TaxID=29902 RepID=UPI003FCC03EA
MGSQGTTKIATKQNQAPTGALKTTGPQSPSSLQVPPSTQVASSVAPPPASLHPPPAHARSTSPTNPSSAEISASAPPLQLPHSTSIPTKRPRSPSSPSPSSKRVAPSGLPAFPPSDSPIDEDTSHAPINSLPPPPKPTRAQAPTLEQPKSFVATPLPSPISPTKLPSFTLPGPPPPAQPSVTLPNAPSALPPHPHSPMRVIITTHVLKFDPHLVSDDQLLQRVVDGLIGLPETIWRELLLSDEGFASRFRQIKARLLQEAEEEEMREQREEAAKAASRVDATRRDEEGGGLGVVRVEKELVCQAVPGKESVVQQRVQGRPSDPSHQPLQLLHQPTLLASPPQAFSSTSNLATPSIPTGLSPLKLVAVQPHPDDAPGPSHSRHPQALQPPQSLRTSSQSQLPSPLPSSVEAAPSTISIPGPSRALPSDASMGPDVVGLPSVKGKKRERVSPFSRRAIFETESSERMVDRPEDEVSPTQSIFYDKQHPNGTSLLEILLTDRAKFRTRARIVDFAPKALEDVVVASCDRCDIDLPSSDKRCRNCNDITGHFTAWRYRLVFVLSDGTASLKAAVFDEEDMLTLFPNLPPASEFANSPTSPMEYLETQIEKLVGKMDSPSSTSTRREGPLLDLSLRKFRADVRGVPGIGKEGWAWSYRVFQTVIR